MPLPDNAIEPPAKIIESRAIYSDCRYYRYFFTPNLGYYCPVLMFIMLNPSRATELMGDLTVTLCTNRAVIDEFGALWVLNVFAQWGANAGMLRQPDERIQLCNDEIIRQKVARMGRNNGRDTIVCAWGDDGLLFNRRSDRVKEILVDAKNLPLYHLGLTNQDQPKHPKWPLTINEHEPFQLWIE